MRPPPPLLTQSDFVEGLLLPAPSQANVPAAKQAAAAAAAASAPPRLTPWLRLTKACRSPAPLPPGRAAPIHKQNQGGRKVRLLRAGTHRAAARPYPSIHPSNRNATRPRPSAPFLPLTRRARAANARAYVYPRARLQQQHSKNPSATVKLARARPFACWPRTPPPGLLPPLLSRTCVKEGAWAPCGTGGRI